MYLYLVINKDGQTSVLGHRPGRRERRRKGWAWPVRLRAQAYDPIDAHAAGIIEATGIGAR